MEEEILVFAKAVTRLVVLLSISLVIRFQTLQTQRVLKRKLLLSLWITE